MRKKNYWAHFFRDQNFGRQKIANSSVSAHTFTYNGLLLATETIKRDGIIEVINRSYDLLGRSTGFTMGDDYSVAYSYDPVGRFSSVTSALASFACLAGYSYLPNSDLLSGLTVAGIGDPRRIGVSPRNRTLQAGQTMA